MTEVVALTFDDGPDPSGTPAVLRALDATGAPATFFVVVPHALRHPALLRDVVASGHDVQLHCWEHVRHSALSRAELEAQTDRALEALDRMGIAPTRWRTPWGDRAAWTGEVAAARGLEVTGWTSDTHDWRGDGWTVMLARLEESLAPGDIVLMHDGIGPGARRSNCRATADLIAPVAALAAARGVRLGPLDREAAWTS